MARPLIRIKDLFPIPHVTLSFSVSNLVSVPGYDISKSFEDAGYLVEKGELVPMFLGTCVDCIGSPAQNNPHFAVAMKDNANTSPPCYYGNTSSSVCFHLEYDESLIILTDGPIEDAFNEFSWGVYLFDTWDGTGRALIQAPIGKPFRTKKNNRQMILVSFMPEFVDSVIENLRLPDIVNSDTYVFALPTDIIETELAPIHNDRICVLLKTIPKDQTEANKFYTYVSQNTEIYKLRVNDKQLRTLIRKIETFGSPKDMQLGFFSGKEGNERTTTKQLMNQVISGLKAANNVILTVSMLALREMLQIETPSDCKKARINCLGEDWDITYTVSSELSIPEWGKYRIMVVGIDHGEGRRTTIGLFDTTTNQELYTAPIPLVHDDLILYVLTISSDCSQEYSPCVQVPVGKTFFLRERSYGMQGYSNLLEPTVLFIKDY